MILRYTLLVAACAALVACAQPEPEPEPAPTPIEEDTMTSGKL
ncbi:MAG: hypothetical protein AAFR98_05875 [Pseudomonadota bacterium]